MPWCKACGTEILWVETDARKPMPLNPEPSPAGTIRLWGERSEKATVLAALELSAARNHAEPLFVSHFATCPEADSFRRGRTD